MSPVIRVSQEIYERLQKRAIPFDDTPGSVIERLLDESDEHSKIQGHGGFGSVAELSPQPKQVPRPTEDSMQACVSVGLKDHELQKKLECRTPRQSGISIEAAGQVFEANTLPELYRKVLKFVVDQGYIERVHQLPIKTSSKRFLLARDPHHPRGNPFVTKVEYRGYFLESSKDYKEGVIHLNRMLSECGIPIQKVY